MGLDAHVQCNCAKQGKAKPFPFPNRLIFDEQGEPQFSDEGLTTEQLVECDRWCSDWGCEHHGYLAQTRIGNISYVAHVRHQLEIAEQERIGLFPLLLSRVVQDGMHAGDYIESGDVAALLREVNTIELWSNDETMKEFASAMRELCKASLASGNAICF
ncbi:MAG: hypothetical protein L0Z53_27890 [Acidobacteriales bacterium]|nr:hypothetical protein [Terriglobales bacterium]